MDTALMLAKTTDCSVINCDIELHLICQIIWDLGGNMSPDDNAGLPSTSSNTYVASSNTSFTVDSETLQDETEFQQVSKVFNKIP